MSFPNNSTQSTTVDSGRTEQSADPFSVEKFEEMLDFGGGGSGGEMTNYGIWKSTRI